jgi:hypothetical protein
LTIIKLASYKIRFHDHHVRAVPEVGLDGCAFGGPGVDLRGEDAARILSAAKPMIDWLDAREPGVKVRSISVRITGGVRVLVSLEPVPGTIENDARPRALRFDAPFAEELRAAGNEAERAIAEAAARMLAKRATLKN